MIIKGSIKKLYFSKFKKDIYYRAVIDHSKGIAQVKKNLKIPQNENYFNSGIQLINLEKIRTIFDIETVITYAVKHNKTLYYCDQDLWNVFFYNHIEPIPMKYNYSTRFSSVFDIFRYPFTWIRERHSDSLVVLHYVGKYKPWKKGYGGKFGTTFYYYAKEVNVQKMYQYSSFNIATWVWYLIKQYFFNT